jgi:CheY-like chemotaxis protein
MERVKFGPPRARVATATFRPSTQTWLSQVLAQGEYAVEILDVSADPVRRVTQAPPDLVILEVKTPSTYGLSLLREIKSQVPDVPVLVVTSTMSSTQALKVIRDGAQECVAKLSEGPFLATRVRRLLEFGGRAQGPIATRRSAASPSGDLHVALPELHETSTGRLDAERIANFLEVPLSKLVAGLGANYAAVHKTPSADSLQEKLIPVKRSLEILATVLGDRRAILRWLNSPHPDLGTRTPMQVILGGQVGAVRTILENAIAGTPT